MNQNIIYIAAIVIQAGIIIFFLRRGAAGRKKQTVALPDDESYAGRRSIAISIRPEQMELTIPASLTVVYGVILDWNLNNSLMTLAAYINGAASLYMSSGQNITGGGKNPIVGEAALAFVVAAGDYVERAMPVATADLPPAGCIRFYLLTNKGLYGAQEQQAHMEDATSPWLRLFELGGEVIEEIKTSGSAEMKN